MCEACGPRKDFDRGNYYESVMKAVNKLRKNPRNKKSTAVLRQAYPYALEKLEEDARHQLASNAPFKWNRVIVSYERINKMYEAIKRSPGARTIIRKPKNYYDEMAEVKEKAAKESYDAGVAAMLKNTRKDAKTAYFHFKDADRRVSGYKEVNDMIKESKFMATLKVVVQQMPVPTRYRLSSEFFQDKVEEYVNSNLRKEFVRFYTPREVKSERLPYVDQYLRIEFDDFVVGQTHTVERTETLSKDSVVVGQVTLEDGTKVDAYNTVKAKMTTFTKKVISNGRVSMKVLDAKGNAVLTHKKFNGEHVWLSTWGRFNGDERALSDKDKTICKRKERRPPPPQDLFIEFTRPIYTDLTKSIRSFYNRY